MSKYQILYRKKNNGISIIDIEKIDKYTELRESGENRFDLKVQIENGKKNVIDFIYREKLYISMNDAKELLNEFLNYKK
jgi:hypothetical protein